MIVNLPVKLYGLTPIQKKYYQDNHHRFIVVSAGRRSRKTLIGKRKLLLRAIAQDNKRFFHAAPTRQQAKQIFWAGLKKDTAIFRRYAKAPNETDLYITLDNGTEIHVIGLDKPERMEGQPWHGGHITEVADIKAHAWDENIRPVLADTKGWCILDGVPDKTKVAHKNLAKRACGGVFPKTVAKKGAYKENDKNPEWAYYSWFSSDVLDQDEINTLQSNTDPITFRQEYEGSYEEISGLPYYAFDDTPFPLGNLCSDIHYNVKKPIIMGFDFNVDPMTAVVGQCNRVDGIQRLELIQGYQLRNSNTKSLCEKILIEFCDTQTFFLTPCQSSIARQTVADIGVTDLRIIKDIFHTYNKNLIICKRTKNPKIIDRINATNSLLYNKKLIVKSDAPGLNFLINDWEQITWKEGTSDLDLRNKMLGHISAALDYVVEYHFPIRRKTKDSYTNFDKYTF